LAVPKFNQTSNYLLAQPTPRTSNGTADWRAKIYFLPKLIFCKYTFPKKQNSYSKKQPLLFLGCALKAVLLWLCEHQPTPHVI
jgi:hypothetical protein